MSIETILGFDVGLSGAICVLTPDAKVGHWEMVPVEEKKGNPAIKTKVSGSKLKERLRLHVFDSNKTVAFVEDPGIIPMNGAVRIVSQHHSLGVVEGVLGAMGITYHLIKAQKWKKHYGLPGGQKQKKFSINLCQQMNPEIGDLVVKQADAAEACLIARYGMKYVIGLTNERGNESVF